MVAIFDAVSATRQTLERIVPRLVIAALQRYDIIPGMRVVAI
jgi:hypothetical protein